MKNAPPIRGQNSSIVTAVDVNINNNNNTNNNNYVNDEGFVTSTTSSNVATSNNVVSVTTPSFVPPKVEFSLPSHAFSPSIRSGEISDSPPHSPLSDDDAAEMYSNLIRGAQAAAKQGDK
jgi:hypothetical protein